MAAIEQAGGYVRYDWEWSNRNAYSGRETLGAAVARESRRSRLFRSRQPVVCFESATATAATIEQVGRLTRLEELVLTQSPLGDAGLVHLKGLSKLKRLVLSGTQVTDASLVHLEGLSNLSDLDLIGTGVTDSGLLPI